jgi:hypothetical protein
MQPPSNEALLLTSARGIVVAARRQHRQIQRLEPAMMPLAAER